MSMERNVYNRRWSQSKRNTMTFILHFFGCLLLLAMYSSADLQNETSILLNMKAAWGNPAVLSGWSRDVNTCSWYSISCDTEKTKVISLVLAYTNLSAPLPDMIGDLVNLEYLDFNNSGLTGNIPSSVGRLKNLTHLNFQRNSLTGQIPTELSNLTKLTYLKLAGNHLNGSIPSEIGSLYNLTLLRLDDNDLTGGIPNEFSNLTKVRVLYVCLNQLSGPIPGWIDKLYSLRELRLGQNNLTGGIPSVFSNLTQLTMLHLSLNMLSGSIPRSMGGCQNLTQLFMDGNKLTGPIPMELSNISTLQILNVSRNELSGPIPNWIAGFQKLATLDLSSNLLTGPVPDDTFNQKTNLRWLSLKDNCLSGIRPTNTVLTLDVGENCFNGDSTCKCGGNHRTRHGISDAAKHAFIAVGVIAGTLLTVASLLISCRHKPKTAQTGSNHYVVKQYTLNEVKDATNNFTTILGAGAFAIVYHAKFKDGKEAAVKHFKKRHTNDTLDEFKKEVDLLAKIHHRFLVNLIGYCTDQGHHMLLFEFMNKGNLKESLRGGETSPGLTWEERVRIMISVGHGLEYLHFGRSPPLIHRDIKSANILLSSTILDPNSTLADPPVDRDSVFPKGTTLIAKIADFGLGRETLLDDDEVIRAYGHEYPKALHTKVAGTAGYIDPEYCRTSVLSSAVDVYSFGVVLLELITGKPALSAPLSGNDSWAPLAEWAPRLENEKTLEIVDPLLEEGGYDKEQLLAVAEQARLCVQSRAHLRPSMRDVVGVFTDLFRVETKLVYPSLNVDYGSSHSSDASQTNVHRPTREVQSMGETTSIATYSSSQVEPRQ